MHEKPWPRGWFPGSTWTRWWGQGMVMVRLFSLQRQLPLNSHNFELEFSAFAKRVQRSVWGVRIFMQESLAFGKRLPYSQETLLGNAPSTFLRGCCHLRSHGQRLGPESTCLWLISSPGFAPVWLLHTTDLRRTASISGPSIQKLGDGVQASVPFLGA